MNPLSLHLSTISLSSASFWNTTFSPTHVLPHHSFPTLVVDCFVFFKKQKKKKKKKRKHHCEFCVSRVGRTVEGWEWAHSCCLMNEGCLWLLGEESSFNVSPERGPGRLYWSGVQSDMWGMVCGRRALLGTEKERWPWRTSPQTAFG